MAGRSITRKRIARTLRWILGAIFIYSGGLKWIDPAAFQLNIANFELIGAGLAGIVAVYLPWLELLCGLAVVGGRQQEGALAILALLLILFLVFVGSAWTRGLDVTCGCFGTTDSAPSYPLWMLRNLALLGTIAAIGWLGSRDNSPDASA